MKRTNAAGLFLVNKEGKLLIAHPTNHDEDVWSIPKGKIDGDETPLEAAIRETFEETNIQVSELLNDFLYLGKRVYRHKKKDIRMYGLLEPENVDWSSMEIKCNSNVEEWRGGFPEMDDYRWVTFEEARLLIHDTQASVLDILKEEIDKYKVGVVNVWCTECDRYVPHRMKLGAGSQRVCNSCDKMNYQCTLTKETDGSTSHFFKASEHVRWVEFGDFRTSSKEPKIGRCLVMSPFNFSFTWMTTPITKIIEQRDGYIHFKTKNSNYKLRYKI